MSSLKFNNVTLQFGGIKALNNVSFDVKPKSLYAIIGPNEPVKHLYLIV